MVPGASVISTLDVGGTVILVKTGPIQVVAIRAFQTALAADAYLQLFDAATAGAVTLGTTKPTWVVMTDFGAGEVSGGDGLPTHGLIFRLGLVIASTTTATGLTANIQQVRIAYL
jgi:hypothetical protein